MTASSMTRPLRPSGSGGRRGSCRRLRCRGGRSGSHAAGAHCTDAGPPPTEPDAAGSRPGQRLDRPVHRQGSPCDQFWQLRRLSPPRQPADPGRPSCSPCPRPLRSARTPTLSTQPARRGRPACGTAKPATSRHRRADEQTLPAWSRTASALPAGAWAVLRLTEVVRMVLRLAPACCWGGGSCGGGQRPCAVSVSGRWSSPCQRRVELLSVVAAGFDAC